MTVTASDGQGGAATQVYTLEATNQAPALVAPTADQAAAQGQAVAPVDASQAFADPNSGDVVRYAASGLPKGLAIDPASGLISGTIAPDATPADYVVTVIATDDKGAATAETFHWSVGEVLPVADGTLPSQRYGDGQGGIAIATAGGFASANGLPLAYDASGLPAGLSIDPRDGADHRDARPQRVGASAGEAGRGRVARGYLRRDGDGDRSFRRHDLAGVRDRGRRRAAHDRHADSRPARACRAGHRSARYRFGLRRRLGRRAHLRRHRTAAGPRVRSGHRSRHRRHRPDARLVGRLHRHRDGHGRKGRQRRRELPLHGGCGGTLHPDASELLRAGGGAAAKHPRRGARARPRSQPVGRASDANPRRDQPDVGRHGALAGDRARWDRRLHGQRHRVAQWPGALEPARRGHRAVRRRHQRDRRPHRPIRKRHRPRRGGSVDAAEFPRSHVIRRRCGEPGRHRADDQHRDDAARSRALDQRRQRRRPRRSSGAGHRHARRRAPGCACRATRCAT